MDEQPWWRSRRVDPVIAGVFLAISLLGAWHIPVGSHDHPSDALAVLACVLAAVGLLLRHVSPRMMLVLVTVGVAIYGARSYPGGPAYLAAPLALFAYGLQRPRRESYAAALLVAAGICGAMVAVNRSAPTTSMLGIVGWACVSVLLADVLRSRQERGEAARRERREQERRTQAQEQLWLSRDLHDSVAHALTAINVQSVIAARQVRSDPDRAEEALEAIRHTTGDALDELGGIVRALRDRAEAPTTPAATLEDIRELVDQADRSGVDVDLVLQVDQPPERTAVAVAAYRVVQEALTNVVRHAPGASARVSVVRAGDRLRVRVVNGPPTSGHRHTRGGGLGQVGMRERVETSGGTLHLGETDDGGYAVEARWEAS